MKRAEERSQAEEALQKAHDQLELRVENRTEELTQTQEALEATVADLQRLQVAERSRSQALETMLDIAQILSQPEDFEQKCGRALGKLAQVIQADLVTLRVLDEKEEALTLVAASGPASRSRPPSAVLPLVSYTWMWQTVSP